MLSPVCGVFIMQYASNAHAASARSYEFGINSLSRLRERAGVRVGEVRLFPLWLSLLPPLGEGRDGGLPALIHAAVALHDSRQFPSCNMPLAPIQQALVAMNLV